jgi:iron complex outermembrane receptor protein
MGKFQALLGLRQDYFTDIVGYNTSNATEVTQHAFLPRLGLVYSANQHINVYGTYVNGYQPQTASVISNPLAGGPFDPLISRLYEVGAKSEWLDKRLVVSTAIYHLLVKGQLYNAGEAGNPDKMIQMGEEISKGVELDVVGYIAPYWTITANYAFNDAKNHQQYYRIRYWSTKAKCTKTSRKFVDKIYHSQRKFIWLGLRFGYKLRGRSLWVNF